MKHIDTEPKNTEPRPLLPTELIAETAQVICDPEENTVAHIDTLACMLRQHYHRSGMDIHDPSRCEYLVLRGVWDALNAPILYAIEADLIGNTLPLIQNRTPLVPADIIDITGFDEYFTEVEYQAESLAFMRATSAWAVGAAERTIRQLDTNPDHWCRPVWELFYDYHPRFCYWERRHRPYKRPLSPYTQIITDTVDSNATVLSILGPALKHLSVQEGFSRQDTRRALLERTEELSWAASANRKVRYFQRLPDISMPLATCPFRTNLADVVSTSLWKIAYLAQGPRRVSGYCPANIPLISPDRNTRSNIDVLFDTAQKDSGMSKRWYERTPGGGKAAEMRTIICAYILAEIYQNASD